jgi:hypothetical protein
VYATLTVSVELPPALIEAGVSVTATPGADEVADRTMVPGPPIMVVAIEVVAPEPWTTVTALGLAAIEKSLGPAVTVTVTEVLWVAPEASMPVTVTTYVPGAVEKSGETVSVEASPALTTVGLREVKSPLGDAVALRLIASEVPVTGAVVIVLVPVLPWTMVTLLGLAETAKSDGAAVTVTVTDVLCVAEPSVPVTVTV